MILSSPINGTIGSVAFDFEDNNVVQFFDGRDPVAEQGFRRILVTEPEHPYVSAWWPPGHGLGYEHGFTHQVVDLVTALAEGRQPTPSFDDGLQVQQVLAAVETSADSSSAWISVQHERSAALRSTASSTRCTCSPSAKDGDGSWFFAMAVSRSTTWWVKPCS